MYPSQVEVTPENIQKLTNTLKEAYASILQEISTATDFGVANRKAILSRIEAKLQELGVDVQTFLEEQLTAQYISGANDAVKQLKNVGADVGVSTGFNSLHTQAIAALVDDASRSFGETLTGIDRSAQLLLGRVSREVITQKLAEGIIGGKATKEVVKIIKQTLQEQGLAALIDKGGRTWQLDTYAEMLYRTKSVEARNRGLINRMVENDYDLVQVSTHFTDHAACAVWEGQILSARGATPGYQTVADAEAAGLFHPNCKHAINVLIPSLASLTRAYDPNTPTLILGKNVEFGKLGKPGASLLPGYEKIVTRELIDPATTYKEVFDVKVQQLADAVGATVKLGPVKKAPRTAEKVLYDYNGSVFAIKDVNRSMLFIDNPYDQQAFNDIVTATERIFGPLAPADIKRGLDITDNYASSKLSVKTPYGARAEIQITTPEMWDAKKNLGGQSFYKIWRDPTTPEDKAQAAYQQMQILYNQAADATKQRLGI